MQFFENDMFRAQLVDVCHLDDLKNILASLAQQQAFDAEFYRTHLQDFETISKDAMPNAKSLMVVACKDPAMRFTFTYAGRTISLLVPPTYLFAQRKVQETVQFFGNLMKPQGYTIAQALLPKKLLAVCSGLAEYGKNNITYVQGFGSYHRLATFFCDMECSEDTWREPVMMEPCKACNVCGKRKDGTFIPCVREREDDVQGVLDAMVAADGIVVATPVYFGLPSDLFSKFIMRTRTLRHQDFKLANKPVGVLAIAGRRSGGAETAIIATWLPFVRNGCLVVGNGDGTCQFGAYGWAGPRGHVSSDEWGLVQAFQTAQRVFTLAAMVKAGAEATGYGDYMRFSYSQGTRT